MSSTSSPVNWTVQVLVPNTEGVLVGKQRKPRPFLAVTHTPDKNSCVAASALAKQWPQGKATVRANGLVVAPYNPGWAEYQAMVAAKRAA